MDSESSDEGQSKKRRKRVKKKKSGMIFQSFCLSSSCMHIFTDSPLGTQVDLYCAVYISAS
jgi:hypothetical protein